MEFCIEITLLSQRQCKHVGWVEKKTAMYGRWSNIFVIMVPWWKKTKMWQIVWVCTAGHIVRIPQGGSFFVHLWSKAQSHRRKVTVSGFRLILPSDSQWRYLESCLNEVLSVSPAEVIIHRSLWCFMCYIIIGVLNLTAGKWVEPQLRDLEVGQTFIKAIYRKPAFYLAIFFFQTVSSIELEVTHDYNSHFISQLGWRRIWGQCIYCLF